MFSHPLGAASRVPVAAAMARVRTGNASSTKSGTAATGAYEPFDKTVTDPLYGVIPLAVAKACEYSYYCDFRDIHARTNGYKLIADLVVGTLPKR